MSSIGEGTHVDVGTSRLRPRRVPLAGAAVPRCRVSALLGHPIRVLVVMVLLAGCGAGDSGDGGYGPAAPDSATTTSAAPTSPPDNEPTTAVEQRPAADRADAVCAVALDAYRDGKSGDPVADQVLSSGVVEEASREIERLPDADLSVLSDALSAYAAIGRDLAVAMDRGDYSEATDLMERSDQAGDRVTREAQAVGAGVCARLATI